MFCFGCGNEIPDGQPCPVCAAARELRQVDHATAFCPGCGNEVEDVHRCPICRDGRATGKSRVAVRGRVCPNCDEPLEAQDFDGVPVEVCPACQGMFFGPGGLATSLAKLRTGREETDLPTILKELREGPSRRLPRVVRYKLCPHCSSSMTRRIHAGVSGVIVDVCAAHGTWVDEPAFGAIADFVSRGGDVLAALRRVST